jgi:flavin-dependent dehydrogenase
VGAGPAGSAAATILASAGKRVLLLEKDRFPRAKVCGEFLSGDAFAFAERLGVLSAIRRAGAETISQGAVHLPNGRSVDFRIPTPSLGISRSRLDELLATRASEAGAHVRFSARVVSVEGGPGRDFSVRYAMGDRNDDEVRARTVIGAWGRWDAMDRELSRRFLARPRYFGWSRDFVGDTSALAGRVELFLYPGGYCGLSRVEGGEVNLAGVVSERRRRSLSRGGAGWEPVLAHARASNAALDARLARLEPGPRGFLGTVPVVFTKKPATENGMLMAGDAAGVIDPFSGQGQAAALASGLLAAETALGFLEGRIPAAGYEAAYRERWRRRFESRFAWSARLRGLMLDPTLGRIAAVVGGRRLVLWGISRLWETAEADAVRTPS